MVSSIANFYRILKRICVHDLFEKKFIITVAVVSTEIMTVNVFVCGDTYNYTNYDNLLGFFS